MRRPGSAQLPCSESGRSTLGAREVRVHEKSFGWHVSIGRIARLHRREAARSRGGTRALAKKRARKHRLTRGTGHRLRRNGARGHVFQFRIDVTSACRVSARRLTDTKRGVLGSTCVRPLPVWRGEVLDRQVNIVATDLRKGPSAVTSAHRAARRPTRACLRVTTENVRGRRGSVKAQRGPRRPKGSLHPRR